MRNVSKVINGKRVIIKKPELLAPAGNLEKLKVAIQYGADAVFVGGKEFSLRSGASNFTLDDIKEAVTFADQYGAAVHVTCNIILHQDNLDGIEEYLRALDQAGVRAIIVADPYIMSIAKKLNLKLEVHVSTQLSTLNTKAIKFYLKFKNGSSSAWSGSCYDDLKTILDKTDVVLNILFMVPCVFIIQVVACCLIIFHVVMLIGVDVHNHVAGTMIYIKVIKKLIKNGVIPFSMSSKDMALINHIPELIELGVDSFKIEGRMKSLHYIATIVSTYRKLIDDYCNDPDNFELTEKYYRENTKSG